MIIGVTVGDPNGVGPEIVLHAYEEKQITEPFVVFGDYEILIYANQYLNYNLKIRKISHPSEAELGVVNVIDSGLLKRDNLTIGKVSIKAGHASRRYIENATKMALNGSIDAIVTLPVNKKAVRLSDESFTGHTELIAKICQQKNYAMMLASNQLIVTHVTTHVPYQSVGPLLTPNRILNVIMLTHKALQKIYQKTDPRIAVAGLNPHAGDNGSFGNEEKDQIEPAIRHAQKIGILAEGPISPDVVFLKAYQKQYDGVVAMYHDQGHIPVKLLDFEGGVNITLGLKVVRTSVDHGTAYDIAYQRKANILSFVNAFQFAKRLIEE